MNQFQKIKEIKDYLNTKFLERKDIVDMLFTCLVARQHMLLIGLAGTGKSAIIRAFNNSIDGSNYFDMLLTKFSTQEEIFGALSLKELEQGIYSRNVKGKLPEANITFLDEIFKANSAILNSLLTIINERVYHNGNNTLKTPLMSVFGGSNEYPEENEGLEALFDRFLIRFELSYIEEPKNFFALLQNANNYVKEPNKITLKEIEELQEMAENVDIPTEIVNVLVQLREKLSNEGIRPSDRRFVQSLSLLRAYALLNERSEVIVSDINILKNGLWETIDQKAKVVEIVSEFSLDKVQTMIEMVKKTCKELHSQISKTPTSAVAQEVITKSKDMITQLEQLKHHNNHRSTEIDAAINSIKRFNQDVTNKILGIDTDTSEFPPF